MRYDKKIGLNGSSLQVILPAVCKEFGFWANQAISVYIEPNKITITPKDEKDISIVAEFKETSKKLLNLVDDVLKQVEGGEE